jgi:hypothetical protein
LNSDDVAIPSGTDNPGSNVIQWTPASIGDSFVTKSYGGGLLSDYAYAYPVLPDPKPAGGTKFDKNKPDFSLIDPYAMDGLAAVLTFGKVKYGAYNWLKGIVYSRLIAATERHLNAIKKGEDIDPESNLPHVDHAMCNLMFLSRFMKTKPELDDRPEENREGKSPF